MDKNWSHELTYKYRGIDGIIHRSRLQKIFEVFSKIDIGSTGKLADFGCSNGYIISLLKENVFNNGKKWNFYGFDYIEKFLLQAKGKNLENAEFYNFNLNTINNNHWHNCFDIVTSFETLEHVGNPENAFINLYDACRQGGRIIFTVPNEKGLPGIIKFIGREILRKNAYGDFFNNSSKLNYLSCLLLDKPINTFRTRNLECWGEHLGFDWKILENFIINAFIETGKCKVLNKRNICSGFNRLYFLEKCQ